jgi:hypothetical protein
MSIKIEKEKKEENEKQQKEKQQRDSARENTTLDDFQVNRRFHLILISRTATRGNQWMESISMVGKLCFFTFSSMRTSYDDT